MTSEPSLGRKTGRAAVWQVFGGGWQTLVRLGASVFLARALCPQDFGLFGLAILVQEFVAYTGALGMNAGVIARQELTEKDVCTCFWTMAVMRCAMFLVAFAGAPLAASFFAEPRLVDVVRVISTSFLISIFEVVSQTLLMKNLRFDIINLIRGSGILLESSLAVILALYIGLSYWALVLAMLANSLYSGIAIFVSARWVPKFIFDWNSFRYLFRFGISGLGFSIANYLNQNLDYMLVGRLLGTQQLGLYEFAYRIPHLIYLRVSQPISAVIFPSLSKVQVQDLQMAQMFEKTAKYVALVAFPALFGLAAVADLIVPVVWGKQWISIVGPLRVLCLCAALRCVPQGIGSVYYCKNRPDLLFWIAVVGLFWTAACVSGLGFLWGITGVSWGMVLSVFPLLYSLLLAYRMMRVSIINLARVMMPIIVASLGCATAAILSKYLFVLLRSTACLSLLGSILMGALTYVIIIWKGFPGLFMEILETYHSVSGKKVPNCLQKLATAGYDR